MRDQALRRVRQVVAVVHPDARVIGHEGDVVALVGGDVERVDPPGTAGRCLTVASQHDHVVAVEVHRVHFGAAVLDVD